MSQNLKKLFAKYIKEKREGDHATLSASGSERWLGCPGSVKLSDGIPSVDNTAGIRGTNTHTLLQFILENDNWFLLLRTKEAKSFLEKIEYDKAMLMNAVFAAKYVLSELRANPHLKLMTEKKVYLEGVGFGTSDIILHQPYGLLHVMDYKNGVKAVEPEENTQGLYYAHAAADLFNWEFSELWITIIQPNAPHSRGHIRTWKTNDVTLERAGLRLKRGALATKKRDAPLVTNHEWCWFCPAKQICPAQQDARIDKLMDRFKESE